MIDDTNNLMKRRDFNIQSILFNYMVQKYPDESNLFLLLSHMPGGLTMKDIRAKTSEKAIYYGDWELFLSEMIEDQ